MPQSYGSEQTQSNNPKPNRLSTFFRKNQQNLPLRVSNNDSRKVSVKLKKKGKVREIHTGFSGPGTGEYYDKFVTDFDRLIEKLLSE